jgi:hypothetical protein
MMVAALCALGGGALAAEGEGPGSLVAFACGTLPERSRVDVQLLDDTPSVVALRDAISRELARDGYTVAADGNVRVTFEGVIERDRDPTREGYLGQLRSTNRATEFTLNMWSSSGDSVIGGVQRPGAAGASIYRLTVFVHDKTNGHCLWQGEARHPLEGNNELDTARRLVPVALRHLGHTVQPTAFALDD